MNYQAAFAEIRELCIEHLCERVGSQLADLAKPGFVLESADKDFQTGRCRAGVDIAFLEPGTPWPQDQQGRPLSVLAVLDTDELTPWLGDELPTRLGLVNIFA